MACILIIDDTVSVLKALEYYLQTLGYTIVLAGNGTKGLQQAAEQPLDLILLDLEMPLVNGIAVCKALKADPSLSRIPVLMMTGQATREARRQALEAGAAVVMTKPFDLDKLEATVAKCIADGGGSAAPASPLPPPAAG